MSRKSLRNALKRASRSASKIGLSSLAFGSVTFGLSGPLHAQNASSTPVDNAKAPQVSSKAGPQARKRLGNPATLRLAASTAPPADGAGLVAQAAPAGGQSVPAPPTAAAQLQEIVVTGIRGSLERALQIKKLSLGVVDAISAEDIGQFPDSSIGEAVQRIPGVSVSRNTMVGGGNSSLGSASGVTVRGFGPEFNETLVDGRPISTAVTTSRAFDFSTVGAEFVGEIDVHKTPDFSLSSGDIGATVNIKYPKPFDHPGLQARAFGSATDYQMDGQGTPAFGALFSDTFADNKFGVLLSGDYTDHEIIGHHVSNVGWEGSYLNSCQMAGGPACTYDASGHLTTPANTFPSWLEQEYQIFLERSQERRKDGRAVFQWHPTDAVLVTLNDDYADDRVRNEQWGFSNWFNAGGISNVTQDSNGTITDFTYGPAPTDLDAGVNAYYVKTNTPGLNIVWDVSDDWSTELDADQSVSKLNPGGQLSGFGQDVGFGPSVPTGTNGYVGGIIDTGAGDLLYPSAYGPNNDGNADPVPILGSHVVVITASQNTDTVNQAKLDATWHHDSTKVNFGVQFVGDTRKQTEIDDFVGTNNEWQLFAGYGPPSNNYTTVNGVPTPDGLALPASFFTGSFSTANFISGWGNGNRLPPTLPLYNPYALTQYEEGLGVSAADADWTPPAGYPPYNGTIQLVPNLGNDLFVQEKTTSPFATIDQNFQVGSMSLKADLGLRYERTNVTTQAYGSLPLTLEVEPSDHTAFTGTKTPYQLETGKNSYHYLLPSLDLNLMVLPDLKVRFDVSRTETKPPLGEIAPVLSYTFGRVGSLTAQGQNPQLLPYLSDNFDLGAEWYYASNDYLSLDAFYKRVSQFPVNETVITSINGVMDPTTGQLAKWALTTYVNGPSADVRGLEVGWQQMLWLGFGLQANVTLVATNAPYDPRALTNVFALPGISDSANFVGFYQMHGFQARVAVNWRGQEFNAFGQLQNNSAFGTEPTFVNPQTEVDFSSSYDINGHVSVFFEGLNLNDGIYSTRGRFHNQTLDEVEYGRTFTLGVRAKL